MILKVRTLDEGGWKFYDDVTEVNHWIAHADSAKLSSCDERFINEEKKLHRWTGEQKTAEMVTVCFFKKRGVDEKRKEIIFNTVAYLLNDEGKTIERI